MRTVFAYGAPPGPGGLGHHASGVLKNLLALFPMLSLYGPAPAEPVAGWSSALRVTSPPLLVPAWRRRYTWMRYLTGAYQHAVDSQFGGWVGAQLLRSPFEQGYFFTQVARESLALAQTLGARTILDNPNGHIRDFREVLCRESERWTGWPYLGHPSEAMVRRVEEEYALADRIRVSSEWSKRSMVKRGVEEAKIFVVPQTIDLNRFNPSGRSAHEGPLRLVFVGSFSLGKGFQYLLEAIARAGPKHFQLEMIGSTGDRWSRRLMSRLASGLDVVSTAGDPRAAYRRGELFVLPTLHDGFGLVVAEAMACGLPVVTTDCCGASAWITPGESGWVLPAGDAESLSAALDGALAQRERLAEMGRAARLRVEEMDRRHGALDLQRCIGELWHTDRSSRS